MSRILLALSLLVASCTSIWAQGAIYQQNYFLAGPTSGSGFSKPRLMVGGDLPNPSVSSKGGVQSLSCATHFWLNTISIAGVPACAQPAFTDISGSVACLQEPARTGDTTSAAGSCTNATVKVNGVAYPASPSTNTIPLVTAANTVVYTAMPNCTSGVIQYSTSTNLFSCGAAGAGTVTSVATAGLATGGPITASGTVTVPAAVKSDQTTATSTSVAVVPAIQQNHPSAVKAWVVFNGSTGTIYSGGSYNVASVTRVSTGIYTVNFTTNFANTAYECSGGAGSGASTGGILVGPYNATPTVSAWNAAAVNFSGSLTDYAFVNVHCSGTQ